MREACDLCVVLSLSLVHKQAAAEDEEEAAGQMRATRISTFEVAGADRPTTDAAALSATGLQKKPRYC